MSRAPFRWPKVEHDIALCREVIASRPKTTEEWEIIATVLSVIFSTDDVPVVLTARACRDHLHLLLKKYKANETIALKRSGTEESYDELAQLLEDISSYLKDMQSMKEASKKQIRLKESADQKKGQKMREAAMQTYNKRKKEQQLLGSSEEESDEDDDAIFTPTKPKETLKKNKKRVSQSNMFEYLSVKHNDNLKCKEKQLALEEKKLELEEKKIALEQKKWELLLSHTGLQK